jgi:hypothetical protein
MVGVIIRSGVSLPIKDHDRQRRPRDPLKHRVKTSFPFGPPWLETRNDAASQAPVPARPGVDGFHVLKTPGNC